MMSLLKGIIAEFHNQNEHFSGTGDNIFLGIVGQDGGREFRLMLDPNVFNQDGATFKVALGTIWDQNALTRTVFAWHSTNNDENDPKNYPIETDTIQHVYVRKQGSMSNNGDDRYEFKKIQVVLYGDASDSVTYTTNAPLTLSNESGHQVWLNTDHPHKNEPCICCKDLESGENLPCHLEVRYAGAPIYQNVRVPKIDCDFAGPLGTTVTLEYKMEDNQQRSTWGPIYSATSIQPSSNPELWVNLPQPDHKTWFVRNIPGGYRFKTSIRAQFKDQQGNVLCTDIKEILDLKGLPP